MGKQPLGTRWAAQGLVGPRQQLLALKTDHILIALYAALRDGRQKLPDHAVGRLGAIRES